MSNNQDKKQAVSKKKYAPICTVEGCEKKHKELGLCAMHASRLRRTGELTRPTKDLSREEYFLLCVNKTDTCWVWTRGMNQEGYGRFWIGTKDVFAHRYSYEIHVGEIPNGFQIDHQCFNKACVNPDHLRLATPKENQEYKQGLDHRNKTGFRGVFKARSGKYTAQVRHNGKAFSKGGFETAEEAGKYAADLRARLYTFPDFEGEVV